ncbi:uncharacterized protein LOC131254852 isoform X2 [Magnolia sinica]|uniref:uncharacterized protein LOC131254852 isoform X2 n=1 Tax=Magnolia sinica TaxID=86752 RepID=UPI0026581D92|nr:uncharacterized protein LOC131254852 isoform X2 [Magnolia sinica]
MGCLDTFFFLGPVWRMELDGFTWDGIGYPSFITSVSGCLQTCLETVVPTSIGAALDINLSNVSFVFIFVTFATMFAAIVVVFYSYSVDSFLLHHCCQLFDSS